ncbi:hypothetical protein EUZ85_09315 [Hahella sp. KA22]|uniref:hypothetical protein n=1 Tax=Hahella sp. KA22 TaxID=1628392 RepID=UPI000FDE87CD|nr:hypothetical protein [Hahella sp. KA22]AZZ90908.1 hypothetical protein ENC22_06760 [Hahella sp. KA22]QAY54278.1 hypothetical protein EUZ85_09315 [Hahella sp. KA22]
MTSSHPSIMKRLMQRLRKRDYDQARAFQCFLCGGITAVCAMATLVISDATHPATLAQDLLNLIVLALLILGLVMAAYGYIRLLIIRLSNFSNDSGNRKES